VRRGGLCAKHMGLKQGATWNNLEEHIGNLKGTYREQRKNEKNPPPNTLHPKLKRKKIKAP